MTMPNPALRREVINIYKGKLNDPLPLRCVICNELAGGLSMRLGADSYVRAPQSR